MEEELKLHFLLSLEEIALRRVAVLLWSDSDVMASILNCDENVWWKTVELQVKDKLLKLALPKSLTKRIVETFRPILLQIERWKVCKDYDLSRELKGIDLPASAKLYWTDSGLIDHRKTALELVRCDAIDAELRFKLAGFNGLEDDIARVWEELPGERKHYYYRRLTLGTRHSSECVLYCWAHIIQGETKYLPDGKNYIQWLFHKSAQTCQKGGVEYFYTKLPHEHKAESVSRAFRSAINMFMDKKEHFNTLACHLVSLIAPEQRIDRKFFYHLFMCFLSFPWPDFFLGNVRLLWSYVNPRSYWSVIYKILRILEFHYYPKSFQELLIHSPPDFRKFIVGPRYARSSYASRILSLFFFREDAESMAALFRHIGDADRARLAFQHDVLSLFYDAILSDKWHLVQSCLREAAQTRGERGRMKELFTEFLREKGEGKIDLEDMKWKRFYDFLDRANASAEKKAQKRKLEDCCSE